MEPEIKQSPENQEEPYYYVLEEVSEESPRAADGQAVALEDILDDSGPNYSQAAIIDEPKDEEPSDYQAETIGEDSNANCFLLLLEVLLNPMEGWKRIRRGKVHSERWQQTCFYPLLAILAASSFSALIYSPRTSLSEMLVSGLSVFVSFFFGYFLIMILMKSLLKENFSNPVSENWVKVYVLVNLSSLAVFFSLIEILPMLWAVLIFLPLWTVYIACRGAKFLRIPESRQITVTAAICLMLIGIPSLLDALLGEILPK